ncbi:unnamed protein product, partial [Chrysoparadoxa australica]
PSPPHLAPCPPIPMLGIYQQQGLLKAFKAHEYVAHSTLVNCVVIGPRSGAVLATGGEDKRVNVWKVGRASNIWSLTGNSSPIEALAFDPMEELLVSGSSGGAVKLYDLQVGKLRRNFRGHMSNVTAIEYGAFDRKFMTTGSMDTVVKLWGIDSKECAMSFKGHSSQVTAVTFSPDGFLLASASGNGEIKLWDLRGGKLLHSFDAGPGVVKDIHFSPVEFLLAAATADRCVRLYDVESLEFFCASPPDSSPVVSLGFSSNGSEVYAASHSSLRCITWDNDTAVAQVERSGEMSWGGVQAMHITAEKQVVAASCASNFVTVWAVDLDDAEEPQALALPPKVRKPSRGSSRVQGSSSNGSGGSKDHSEQKGTGLEVPSFQIRGTHLGSPRLSPRVADEKVTAHPRT